MVQKGGPYIHSVSWNMPGGVSPSLVSQYVDFYLHLNHLSPGIQPHSQMMIGVFNQLLSKGMKKKQQFMYVKKIKSCRLCGICMRATEVFGNDSSRERT